MGTNAYYLNQFISTTLATVGGIDDSQTTGIILTSVTGVETTKPGIVCLSYSDPIDTSKAEWISYTSISVTNELQGVTRGAEGFSAKSHSNGVTIAFPISESHINNLNDALIIGGSATNLATGVIDDDTFATASATKLATSESIKNFVGNGWTPALETWTYASATTITVPSGATSKYQKGDKIKLTQTTVKYFYIIGVADTLLTITGGSDYTLTNATITNNYYSKVENPQGFPEVFNHSSVFEGFSSAPTNTFKFFVKNSICYFFIKHSANGTSNANGFAQSLPITASLETRGTLDSAIDNSTIYTIDTKHIAWLIRNVDYSKIYYYINNSSSGWTASGGKRIVSFFGFYLF